MVHWHVLRPDASIKSFRDYTDKKVIPYIETLMANTKMVDVIWDRNLPAGIKQRMRHDGNGKFPRNLYLSAERKQQGGMVTLSASSHCSDRIL